VTQCDATPPVPHEGTPGSAGYRVVTTVADEGNGHGRATMETINGGTV